MQNEAEKLSQKIFEANNKTFNAICLEVFQFQFDNNPLYRNFCQLLKRIPGEVRHCENIPFLPIGFFKLHQVKCTSFNPQAVFESSGTTGTATSRHFIKDLSLYERSFLTAFNLFYGEPGEYCILGLLPSYLERGNSSLVYMVKKLIDLSKNLNSGFYLDNYPELARVLLENVKSGTKTILIGVTYALIDFSEKFPMDLSSVIVMETGGMKGRKKEMLRNEVHDFLKGQWEVEHVHSEYGMTELLSQAYSKGEGLFISPPWMKVLCRDEDDPLGVSAPGVAAKGGANIIDLANLFSCSFIATDDLARCNPDGSFEVEGRLDHSDLRGCNLMFSPRAS